MSKQHAKSRRPSDKDLQENPGIGTSKGTVQGDDLVDGKDNLGGDNTFKGDIGNDVTPQGGIDPRQRGRTNR